MPMPMPMPMRCIAQIAGRSVGSIARVLAQLGLSCLNALAPKKPVAPYKQQGHGDLLHMDTKKPHASLR